MGRAVTAIAAAAGFRGIDTITHYRIITPSRHFPLHHFRNRLRMALRSACVARFHHHAQ